MSVEPRAPAAVREMIEAAGIKRIVCVDDSYAVDVEDLITRLAPFEPEQREVLFGEDMGPDSVWQKRIRERWDEIGPEVQATLVDGAAALEQDLDPVLTGFAEIVTERCPEMEFLHLSLADWKTQRDAIIAAIPEAPTLILFDQDFSNENGAANEGQKLVAELQRKIGDRNEVNLETFYGILTNTVSIEQEHTRRTEIVAEATLDAGRFVLISKQSLKDGAELLPERLRPVLLSPLFARLTGEVGEAVAAAQDDARKRATEIPPEDLEQMVLQSSNQEGIWPPDTLLRILETMQRETVRQSLREEKDLLSVAERVEAVANVVLIEPARVDEKGEDESTEDVAAENKPSERVPVAARISNEEIYERAEHLNSLHLPIDLGDLFKNTATNDLYVLIAQPCNLMVREQGKRAYEPSHMLLAKVSAGTVVDKTQFKLFELPYFDKETGESNFVRLNGPKIVRTLILDATVLNPNGRARLDLASDEPVAALLPYWKKRRERLYRLADELLKQFEKLPDGTQHEVWVREALGGSFRGDPFPLTDFSPEDKLIAWGCERIGRVRDPYARALLSRFSQYFARDAYLHDLARQ